MSKEIKSLLLEAQTTRLRKDLAAFELKVDEVIPREVTHLPGGQLNYANRWGALLLNLRSLRVLLRSFEEDHQ